MPTTRRAVRRGPLGGATRWACGARTGAGPSRLLWGGYRGLLFYAPILMLAPLGWVALLVDAGGRSASCLVLGLRAPVFLVNVSYPEWTGGWSTGPRLLVPLLPFAMIAVAGALAAAGRRAAAVGGRAWRSAGAS